jgi:osmotically-inducible protein OsmY
MKLIERTDTDLKSAVTQAIAWMPSVNSTHIGVSVTRGVVTLSGEVDSYPERYQAEKAALRVRGVNAVAEEITVRGLAGATDSVIAREAHEALERAVDVPKDAVKVTVQNHVITLTGDIAWQYQREAAARAVRYLNGVTGIHNNLSIKPVASAAGIKSAISDALTRDAQLEARNITVVTDGGHVTLEGKVHTWSEQHQADWAAWSAPGVSAVTNNLRIGP